MRAIDADRLLDRCKFYHLPNGDIAVPIIDVQHAPTIEPERKKGKWTIKNGELAYWDVCSTCGKMVIHKAPFYNFCPNCGADMRGEHE